MALTDTALKALKPKDKTYTVTDSRDLYVEVFPSGGITWRYRYRLNGKYEKLPLGKYPGLTLKNARFKRDEAAQLVAVAANSRSSCKTRTSRPSPSTTCAARLHPAARTGLALRRSGKSPQPHHRRRARRLQPGGVCEQRKKMLQPGRISLMTWRRPAI